MATRCHRERWPRLRRCRDMLTQKTKHDSTSLLDTPARRQTSYKQGRNQQTPTSTLHDETTSKRRYRETPANTHSPGTRQGPQQEQEQERSGTAAKGSVYNGTRRQQGGSRRAFPGPATTTSCAASARHARGATQRAAPLPSLWVALGKAALVTAGGRSQLASREAASEVSQ